ncbi:MULTISPECIES: hypothetical protein [Spirosoma]|uniref:DUF4239 domain-containing protein n=1 Tax=Spirosoma sordidisoli TaxID=2502893 RepID=A0A4Q2UHM7_9BACT|nr:MULTISPECIES: hypothetical protein [Spirosoma]PHK29863.1 hypothetical protein VF13_39940 [Nostoc linckia z16]RYC66229.1 hypothetical protein EQG79_30715 [Spirosoma sordidisoli]
MKTRLLKAGVTLLLLLLVNHHLKASMAPSGEAHEVLVKRLSTSRVFRDFTLSMGTHLYIQELHRQTLTEAQAAKELARANSYLTHSDYLLMAEKEELAQMSGYSSWDLYQQAITRIDSVRHQFWAAFPDILMMPQTEAQAVMQRAIAQISADLVETLENIPNLKQCLADANPQHVDCLGYSKTKSLSVLIKMVSAACFTTAMLSSAALYSVIRAASEQRLSSSIEYSFIIHAFTFGLSCSVLSATTFGLANYVTQAQKIICEQQYKSKLGTCLAKYGH